MIRGLYSAVAGMVTDLMRMESVSHNLSNLETPGYKQRLATTSDFSSLLLARLSGGGSAAQPGGTTVGTIGTGVTVDEVVTDWSEGSLKQTENLTDLALSGEGFFKLQTPDGVRYTRDGSFHRDADHRLGSADGYPVLGLNGPLTLPDGELLVAEDGTVTVNGTVVDQLDIVTFDQLNGLVQEGKNLFSAPAGTNGKASQARVLQGYLEESNVNPTLAMLEMMSVARAYEASQRMVQAQNRVLEKAVSEVGRV